MNGHMTKYTFKMVSRDDGRDSMEDDDIYLEVYNNEGEQEALRRAKYQNTKNKWRSKMILVKTEQNKTAYEHTHSRKNSSPSPDEGPSVWYRSPQIGLRIQ